MACTKKNNTSHTYGDLNTIDIFHKIFHTVVFINRLYYAKCNMLDITKPMLVHQKEKLERKLKKTFSSKVVSKKKYAAHKHIVLKTIGSYVIK